MSEWFWFLLPVAIACGWFFHFLFRNYKQSAHILPKSYVQQLNTLLRQRHNKAVDKFINLFEVNKDTVETHILFGNLFRQRGETEEAIRIHQNVINKSKLSSYYCAEAMLELARDYFEAGLYDRAERLLQETLSLRAVPIQVEICHQLIRLYEIEKNWSRAITTAKKLHRLLPTEIYSTHIAHYYCELAEKALAVQNYSNAEKMLIKAKSHDTHLLRVDILLGDIALRQKNFSKARKYYELSIIRYPDFAYLIFPKIRETLRNSDDQFIDYLNSLKIHEVSAVYIDLYFQALVKADRESEVENFFYRQTDYDQISLSMLVTLLQYEFNKDKIHQKDLMKKVTEVLMNYTQHRYTYKCSNCGFDSTQLYWQCPSCWHWDAYSLYKKKAAYQEKHMLSDTKVQQLSNRA